MSLVSILALDFFYNLNHRVIFALLNDFSSFFLLVDVILSVLLVLFVFVDDGLKSLLLLEFFTLDPNLPLALSFLLLDSNRLFSSLNFLLLGFDLAT